MLDVIKSRVADLLFAEGITDHDVEAIADNLVHTINELGYLNVNPMFEGAANPEPAQLPDIAQLRSFVLEELPDDAPVELTDQSEPQRSE